MTGRQQLLTPEAFFALVARVTERDAKGVSDDTPLAEVIVDSFAALELYVAIEEATGITVEWDPTMDLTLGDLYRVYAGVAAERQVGADAD